MAICSILEDLTQTPEQAARIAAHLLGSGSALPDGARLLLCGPASRGWRVITVWDSPEARDRFLAERLAPAYEAAGSSLQSITRAEFRIQMLIAGDLVGPPTQRELDASSRSIHPANAEGGSHA
jgi:hypothetical protein